MTPVASPPWRLLIEGDLPGSLNMARDISILESVAAGKSEPLLRLYGWSPPCLSLGKHQTIDAVDLGFCEEHGVDVVRRPTGGRAVLHHLELTYSLISPLGRGNLPGSARRAYVTLCSALVNACDELGVSAGMTGDEANRDLPSPRSTIPCFKAPAGGEVMASGRKLIGSALRAHGGTILQHGSILLDWDGALQAGSMGLDSDASLRPFVTTFADQLEQLPPRSTLEAAFVSAFSTVLATDFVESSLSREEHMREEELRQSVAIQEA